MATEDATTRKSPDAQSVEATAKDNAIASSTEAVGDDARKFVEKKEGTPVVGEEAKDDETSVETAEVAKTNGDEKNATKEASDRAAADVDATVATETTALEKTAATPASKKKGGAKAAPKSIGKKKSLANYFRRKSTGGPAAAADTKYEIGQYVLAKMRSFPPWPAVILSKELLPDIMAVKPAAGNAKSLETLGDAAWTTQYPIFYMGTYE